MPPRQRHANATPAPASGSQITLTVSNQLPRGVSTANQREQSPRLQSAGVLAAVIFYGLIGLLLCAPIPYGSIEPWAQAVLHCAVFALAFLWCIHAALSGSWFSGDVRLFLPLIATIAFAVLQSLAWSRTNIAGVSVNHALSADPYESWIFVIRLLAVTVAGLM